MGHGISTFLGAEYSDAIYIYQNATDSIPVILCIIAVFILVILFELPLNIYLSVVILVNF